MFTLGKKNDPDLPVQFFQISVLHISAFVQVTLGHGDSSLHTAALIIILMFHLYFVP